MKKQLIAALVAAFVSVPAFAQVSAVSVSGANVGSTSMTANVQNGFAIQGTKVGAYNTSNASASKIVIPGWFGGGTVITNTTAGSTGGTFSASFGAAYGAFGATGGVATQGGFGAAIAH